MESNDYTDLIRQIKATGGNDPVLARRITELISLNELVATLNTEPNLNSVLDLVLLTIMGEYPCRLGAVFIWQDEKWKLGISKGIPSEKIDLSLLPENGDWDQLRSIIGRDSTQLAEFVDFLENTKFQFLFPMRSERHFVGMIALGPSALRETFCFPVYPG